jgi:hypothetical protein
MLEMRPSQVAAIPNLAEVHGRLLCIRPEQGGPGNVWDIAVDETQDVEGLPNYTRAYLGKTISAYAHAQLRSDVRAQQHFRARIAYRGGANGGRFVIVEDAVRSL